MQNKKRDYKTSRLNFVCCAVIICFTFLLTGFEKQKVVRIGEKPPEFFLSDLSGNLISLHQFKGKVIILYFWADWCCKDRTLLTDEHFYKKYKEKGLIILAINAGQPKKVVERFVKERTITYDVLLDLRFSAAKEYGILNLPTIFIIDKTGLVREKILGQVEVQYLERILSNLL